MEIRRAGKQTWLFPEGVGLLATAAVCGPREGEGPLSGDFDHIFPDLRMGQDSFEKAEQYLGETAVRRASSKAALSPDDIDIAQSWRSLFRSFCRLRYYRRIPGSGGAYCSFRSSLPYRGYGQQPYLYRRKTVPLSQ